MKIVLSTRLAQFLLIRVYLMSWRKLKEKSIEPSSDLASLKAAISDTSAKKVSTGEVKARQDKLLFIFGSTKFSKESSDRVLQKMGRKQKT